MTDKEAGPTQKQAANPVSEHPYSFNVQIANPSPSAIRLFWEE